MASPDGGPAVVSGVVVRFPSVGVLTAHRVLREPTRHSPEALGMAATLLVRALQEGLPTPPGTIDRLVWFALDGPGSMDLRQRLADELSLLRDDERRVRGRALAQLRDPATPKDRRAIATRLLGCVPRPVPVA